MKEAIDKLQGKQRSALKITNCLGSVGGDCFLIRGKGANILVDTGFAFAAGEMLLKIKKELEGEKLDYILLTHSHYDHAMGVPFLKREYPEAKVIGSEYCNYILTKPSARKRMQEMDDKASAAYGKRAGENLTEALFCDITVKDAQEIVLGEERITAVAFPGHTRCCMGYFFNEERLLVSCETLGIYADNMKVFPGCLIGYEMTLEAIERARRLGAKELLIPHSGILYNKDIKSYLDESEKVTRECKELIVTSHRQGADFDRIVEIYKESYYSEKISESYPEHALMANLSAQIPMFIAECGTEKEKSEAN